MQADEGGDQRSSRQDGEPRFGGILRVDSSKPRRSSGSSVEFRNVDRLGEDLNEGIGPASPAPSVDRLSVTWADIEKIEKNIEETLKSLEFVPGTPPPPTKMEVRFPPEEEGDKSDEEDYSASISAIMLRRASTKKQRRGSRSARRPSTPYSLDPFNPETRRRSSVFTTSSGETVISIEESPIEVTQEQIFENIRLHKEVLRSVKQQPLEMKRKRRLVNQAKSYIKKHKGVLQDGLAKSGCGREIFARFNLFWASIIQHSKREMANLSKWFIPWELRIKEIESHFGSVVASYFTFLRWLFWVNMVISIVIIVFMVVPEILIAKPDSGERKVMLQEERNKSTELLTLWEFEGILKYSPIFYGYYTNRYLKNDIYNLPLAYFMTGLAVYIYSFVATLRKMAENSRMSKLSEKDDECIFSWKLFTAWDYMIGNTETAHNRKSSIILGFKEALLEEAEKKKDQRNWKIIFRRVIVNICILLLLGASAYAVVMVVGRSQQTVENNWWRQNEITIVMSLISYIFPNFFELLGLFENYHPRRQLRIQLARIMVLNLLNLYSLIIALFNKITGMSYDLQELKHNVSMSKFTPSSLPFSPFVLYPTVVHKEISRCYQIKAACRSTTSPLMKNVTIALMTTAIANMTTTTVTDSSSVNTTIEYDSFTSYTTPQFLENLNYSTTDMSVTNQNFTDLYMNDNYTTSMSKLAIYYDNDTETGSYEYEIDENDPDLSSISVIYVDKTSDSDYNLGPYSGNYTEINETNTRTRRNVPDDIYSASDEDCYESICLNYTANDPSEISKAPLDPINVTDIVVDDINIKKMLRKLCWETMFGQELVKLTVMDLCLTILTTLFMDFFRAVFIKYMNSCWCWDLEKRFPQYGDFKIAENILHLVNNQGMVWMGMFFSPGLVVLNLIKLIFLMYLRSWAVMTCNVPHEVVFRASRSNNFYLALLLTMLFLCVLPVGYAIVWIEPSWHCGPFSGRDRIYHFFTESLYNLVPITFHRALEYIASPGIVIPLLVLLILIIYYLVSLTNALREANNDLKIQLRRERTEERRKMFQLANKRRGNSNDSETTPFSKWKKIMPILPKPDGKKDDAQPNETDKKDLLAKIVKLAFRKSSATSNEESGLAAPAADDETDTEFHESLPDDVLAGKDINIGHRLKKAIRTTKNNVLNKMSKLSDSDEKQDQNPLAKPQEEAKPPKSTRSRPTDLVLEKESRRKRGEGQRTASEDDDKKQHKVTIKNGVKDNNEKQKEGRRSRQVSAENREDSITSIIPVITISKTESDEDILEKEKDKINEPKGKDDDSPGNSRVLRRQSGVESARGTNFPTQNTP